jgi:glycosyltransferase involved in cell wall biosynthesis
MAAPLRVVHVTSSLSGGGAARALLTLTPASAARDHAEHSILSLGPAAPAMAERARTRGVAVVEEPDRASLLRELGRADVVVVEFYNTPELYEFLRSELPPMRVVLSSCVNGIAPPHILTRDLVDFADLVVATGPEPGRTLGEAFPVIPSPLDPTRLVYGERGEHGAVNVGYVGTVDPTKLHPRYVELCDAVTSPDAHFVVCGFGDGFRALARRARDLGIEGRFTLCGYVEDVGSLYSRLDVLGYPLCDGTSVTSDAVVREAMYCAVPPVVLRNGLEHVVKHQRTGIVADDEAAYVHAIDSLCADRSLRLRLGAAARVEARASWPPARIAMRWQEQYSIVMHRPKRERALGSRALRGAAAFIHSLGPYAPQFATSATSDDSAALLAADELIAESHPILASASAGGVLHYRRHYPDDPLLSLWSGLVFARTARDALAIAEFTRAIRQGLGHWRAELYLAGAATRLGQAELAAAALARLPAEAAAFACGGAKLAAVGRGAP